MAIFQLLLALFLVVGGILLFKHGISLPTAEEDKDRDYSFINEFLNGPPGYGRARGLVGGIVLIIMGFVVVAFMLFGFR